MLGTKDGRGALLAVVDPLVPRVVLVSGRTQKEEEHAGVAK